MFVAESPLFFRTHACLGNLAWCSSVALAVQNYDQVPHLPFVLREAIMHTTIVVGSVAAGGLGMELGLSMGNFHYTTATLLPAWY